MRYGEKEIKEFEIDREENFWSNGSRNRYKIDITLPEFMCRCPRSGYPDFATIRLSYVPDEKVIELKALKLYINSFMDRYISHEDATNEIFDVLSSRLKPHWIRVVAEFNPRGNVHTTIEIDSEKVEKGF